MACHPPVPRRNAAVVTALPVGPAARLRTATARAAFGNAIAWMCRRRGIAPGHKDWPDLSRAIVAFGSALKGSLPANVEFVDPANVAFGGTLKGFRLGLPARGLQWWENPSIPPGSIGDITAQPLAATKRRYGVPTSS